VELGRSASAGGGGSRPSWSTAIFHELLIVMLTSFLTTRYEMHLRAKKLILNKNDDQSLFEKNERGMIKLSETYMKLKSYG
jgi:hypothetical protein